jgi:hypothetical protein
MINRDLMTVAVAKTITIKFYCSSGSVGSRVLYAPRGPSSGSKHGPLQHMDLSQKTVHNFGKKRRPDKQTHPISRLVDGLNSIYYLIQ